MADAAKTGVTGVILAAGFGSRLRGVSDKTELKPLTLVGGLPLLQRAVRSLEVAGCARVVVVVGHGRQDVVDSLAGYAGAVEIVFADNPRFDLKNGVSVLAARPHLLGPRFILSMADHVLGDEVMHLAGAHVPPKDGATLLVDWKLASIFDMDDATKVLAEDAGLGPQAEGSRSAAFGHGEQKIARIGKTIPEYNCVDVGVFVCTTALMDRIAEFYAAHGDASLSEGVQALAGTGRMTVLDIGDGFWQDVDTPEMLAHAERELTRRAAGTEATR